MKKETIITISPWHLTQKTLDNYIRVDNKTQQPKLEEMWGFCVYSFSTNTIILKRMATYHYEETDTDNDVPIPQDLLDLINWMIKEDIEYVTFDDTLSSLYNFTQEEWNDTFTNETFLPFYDTASIKKALKL